MSARCEFRWIAAVVSACLPLVCVRAVAAEPVYTVVASCRAQDLGPDEFVRHCKGPSGYAATLHYFDGRAVSGFGKAKPGTWDEFDLGSVDAEPIEVGTGEPFGKRIEWVMSGTEPCAAILRIGTSTGGRLAVTALDGSSTRLAMARTNEEARKIAARACRGHAPGKPDKLPPRSPAADAGPAPTARPKVGDDLPICSKCPVPVITKVSSGSDLTVAARIDTRQAEEHCDAWYPADAAGRAMCVDGVMQQFGRREFVLRAACTKLELVSDGRRYRHVRKDGRGTAQGSPEWLTVDGRAARSDDVEDLDTISTQFDVLCPGVRKGMGF